MVDYIRQIKARLVAGDDEALDERLQDYAQRVQQSDLIRLALYYLLDVQLPPSLERLADEFEKGPLQKAAPIPNDLGMTLAEAIERMGDKLAQVLEPPEFTMIQQQTQMITTKRPNTLPELDTIESSGIDLSRPRPRKPLPRSTPPPAAEPEPELTDQQQIELAQIMAASVRNAQPGRR